MFLQLWFQVLFVYICMLYIFRLDVYMYIVNGESTCRQMR